MKVHKFFIYFFVVLALVGLIYFYFHPDKLTDHPKSNLNAQQKTVSFKVNSNLTTSTTTLHVPAFSKKENSSTEIDLNSDGVPDRLNHFIDAEYSDSELLRQALVDLSQAWYASLDKDLDDSSRILIANQITHHIDCLLSPRFLEKTQKTSEQIQNSIYLTRAELLNTPTYTEAYIRFNESLNGKIFLDSSTETCFSNS